MFRNLIPNNVDFCLTCYPNLNIGADCVRWLGPAVVVTSVCFCSTANIQHQAHIGEDGRNIDKRPVLGHKNIYYTNNILY